MGLAKKPALLFKAGDLGLYKALGLTSSVQGLSYVKHPGVPPFTLNINGSLRVKIKATNGGSYDGAIQVRNQNNIVVGNFPPTTHGYNLYYTIDINVIKGDSYSFWGLSNATNSANIISELYLNLQNPPILIGG